MLKRSKYSIRAFAAEEWNESLHTICPSLRISVVPEVEREKSTGILIANRYGSAGAFSICSIVSGDGGVISELITFSAFKALPKLRGTPPDWCWADTNSGIIDAAKIKVRSSLNLKEVFFMKIAFTE